MADKHPYVSSGAGAITKAVEQFRKSIPSTVDAATLKKLGIAPNNESYLIGTFRFIGLVSEAGAPTDIFRKVFTLHDDSAFQKEFSALIETAYKDLFDLHGDAAWELSSDQLITFFRQSDQTSALVGGRQATTFHALASMGGHGEIQQPKPSTPRAPKKPKESTKKNAAASQPQKATQPDTQKTVDWGMSVRIEINLPVSEDQKVYDRIFKSIRENLLNG